MVAPIGLQRYTLRKALAEDFEGTVKQVAEIGYVGFQTGIDSFGSQSYELQLFKSLGLLIPSVHTQLPLDDEKRAALENLAASGGKDVIVSYIPAEEFQSLEKIKRTAERINEADEIVRQYGMTLSYHNHWWEFEPNEDGRTPHALMREYLNPTVNFELDVYWAQVGGSDPIKIMNELGTRVPFLHIKDGPAIKGEPMTAVGTGKVDIDGIIKASEGITKWQIVELDECATDMMEAVRQSYTYLVSKGLAYGNKS
jgi:sugar phosphate isomerase/epimerase